MTNKNIPFRNNQSTNKSDVIDLGKLLCILLDGKWVVIFATILFMIVGVIYALSATPIYKADALVQVEEKSRGVPSLGNDVADMFAQESSSVTEIGIIKSRMILIQTVDKFNLTILSSADYWSSVYTNIEKILKLDSFLSFTQLLATKTSISVSKFEIPEYAAQAKHQIVLLDNAKGTYQLINDHNMVILSGTVGVLVEKEGYQLLVTQLKGEKNQKYNIGKRSQLAAIRWLKKSLSVSEMGKKSGLLLFSFTGKSKAQIKDIVYDISTNYFLQNLARNAEMAKNSLDFVNTHLPKIKNKLTEYENKLNNFKSMNDSVNLGMEAQSTLDVIVSLEAQLNDITFKESDISKLFTKKHPSYIALLDKRKTLQERRKVLNAKIQALPKKQREILRIMRDVEVNQAVYLQLLNKKQELSIVQASTVGNVRILDNAAVYDAPIKPKKTIIVGLATMLGGMFSVAFLIVASAFKRGVESPEQIEEIGLSVYATIPKSAQQIDINHKIEQNKKYNQKTQISQTLLAIANPADLSIEALRNLRSSLYFALMDATNNIIMISGPSPDIGKSFVATNLAAVISKVDQKVLIIDADMRRGRIERILSQPHKNGLSDILLGDISVEQGIKTLNIKNVDFISRGKTLPNPSELLMHQRFKQLLDWASDNYDIVIIDTPPLLAVTDSSIVGKHCGTTLLIAHFGKTSIKEIEVTVKRFAQNGINVKGVILNSVEKTASSSYSYGYYNYNYDIDKF
ncbi:polysaccharide biosynthesis tyrosine autokinase [Moritella sp. 24]|uniref:polysaccharide biosynthesis tyrosine autokinase n=1 Tax=Moritella sp. 24 TaxID=2746230 RepID=UPI001BA7E275|nr:polysaccharide biosynthesis tyrosine autokinase [Moritella sp. 24]QUM75964.1 polysaccharide biosynthesis tyrosine autokinase [Moritella sp. 24]